MFRNALHLPAAVMFGALGLLWARPADGQVIVGRGGGGISVAIPGVGGVRVGAPLRYRGAGIYVSPFGLSPYPYGAPYGLNDPAPYQGRVTRYAARPITPSSYQAQWLPSSSDLQVMNDSELLNAIVTLQEQLSYELNRFDTAATWQRYLLLPDEALPPADDAGRVMLGTASIAETLKRFDLTLANSRYEQISGLPSFAAMHAALGELSARLGGSDSMATGDDPSGIAPSGAVPPAKPSPPVSSIATADPDGRRAYEPRSIEMRNLHEGSAVEVDAAPPASASAESPLTAQAASSVAEPEQLPAPPPALVAPQNNSGEEHSILSR